MSKMNSSTRLNHRSRRNNSALKFVEIMWKTQLAAVVVLLCFFIYEASNL